MQLKFDYRPNDIRWKKMGHCKMKRLWLILFVIPLVAQDTLNKITKA
jgi:hypothetical protein